MKFLGLLHSPGERPGPGLALRGLCWQQGLGWASHPGVLQGKLLRDWSHVGGSVGTPGCPPGAPCAVGRGRGRAQGVTHAPHTNMEAA